MDLLKSPISAVATSSAVGPPTTATRATSSGATQPGQTISVYLVRERFVLKTFNFGRLQITGSNSLNKVFKNVVAIMMNHETFFMGQTGLKCPS